MGEVKELSKKVDRLEEVLIELAVAQRRSEEEGLRLKQSLRELSEAQRRTEEAQQKTEESLREFQRRTEESLNKLNRKLIELSDRLGTLAEDILAPGIPYLLEGLGYRVKSMWVNEEVRRSDGVNCEFGVVAVAERGGEEVLFLCEVKSKLREKHFEQLNNQCKLYKEYGMRRDLFIIPVLAALNIPEHLVNYANKRGVLLVKMGGDYLEALNPEVVNL